MSIFFVSLFFLFAGLVSVTYSKYVKENTAQSTGTVASYKIDLSALTLNSVTQNIALEEVYPSMSAQNYELTLTNGTLASFSEVALGYTISLSKGGYLPLSVKLKEGSSTLFTLGENITGTSSQIEMENTSLVTNVYTISVEWSSSLSVKGSEYSGLLDYLEITIDWVQID